jgi:hypothetical protein
MTKKEYGLVLAQIEDLKDELKSYDLDDRFNNYPLYRQKQRELNGLRQVRDSYKPRKVRGINDKIKEV